MADNSENSTEDERKALTIKEYIYILNDWVFKPFIQGLFYGVAFQIGHSFLRIWLVHKGKLKEEFIDVVRTGAPARRVISYPMVMNGGKKFGKNRYKQQK